MAGRQLPQDRTGLVAGDGAQLCNRAFSSMQERVLCCCVRV
jgi:hypothetical protein